MAQGLWNIGGINLPDLGINEFLGIGPQNAAIVSPEMSSWQQYSQPLPSNTQLSPQANTQLNVAPTPPPKPNIPGTLTVPTPEPAPTAGISKDNLLNYFPGYQGWNLDAAYQDFLKTGGAGKGGSIGGTSPFDFESIYAPERAALNELTNVVGLQRDTALSGLEQQKGSIKSAYEQAFGDARSVLGDQNVSLAQSQRSLQSEAVRQANAAQQQARSLYGNASSAGGALSEIIMQEFARTTGGLREKFTAGQLAIQREEQLTQRNYLTAIQEVDDKFLQGTKEINTEAAARLAEINMKKAELESSKQSMRQQILMDSVNNARTLQQYKTKALFDVGVWKVQRDEELGKANATLNQIVAQVKADVAARNQSMTSDVSNSMLNWQPQNYANQMIRSTTRDDDPYKSLLI